MEQSKPGAQEWPPQPTSIRVISVPVPKKFELTYARPVLGAMTIAWTAGMALVGRYAPASAGGFTLLLFILSLVATAFALSQKPLQPYAKIPAFATVMTMGLYFVVASTAGLPISLPPRGGGPPFHGVAEGIVIAAPLAIWIGGALAELFTNERSRKWPGATLFVIWTVAGGGTVVALAGLFALLDPRMDVPPASGLYSYLALGGLTWIALWSALAGPLLRELKRRALARQQALARARSMRESPGPARAVGRATAPESTTPGNVPAKAPRIVKTARVVGESESSPPMPSDPLK